MYLRRCTLLKILYIHQYFKTPREGGALRSYYIAKAMVQAGHIVEVITTHNEASYLRTTIDGITVHYLPIAYHNSFHFAKRILSFLRFFLQSYRLATRIKCVDLNYVTSTPLTVGLTALRLKRKKNIDYVFEVRDLWPEAVVKIGAIRNKFVQRYLYRLEQKIYTQSQKIITLSPGMFTYIQKVVPSKPLLLAPNMSSVETIQPTATRTPFTISYLGTLGKANHVDYLLDIAELMLNSYPEVRFYIMGEGAQKVQLEERVKNDRLTNVTFLAASNQDAVKGLLAKTDATYTSFLKIPILETNSPNKFFDSLAAGKLTIVSTNGWLRNLVEENHCGFYHDPENPYSFLEKIKPYIIDKGLLDKTQANARKLAETKFSVNRITEEILEFIAN